MGYFVLIIFQRQSLTHGRYLERAWELHRAVDSTAKALVLAGCILYFLIFEIVSARHYSEQLANSGLIQENQRYPTCYFCIV